eukprot:TRINITY_DN15270_c0_g1_i5.p1 TRINITY_DN15270_c0_g1~~TRINITY_DN15270_c0_g1_i5.p1  ORF type:complete len:640 (-),score=198.89 TRINITY_DN15270_c0_g1_i5:63-1982(-)
MKDGVKEASYFDLYPKERLKKLQSACGENIKRMNQRFGVVALEMDFLQIEEAKDKYLMRQPTDPIPFEDLKGIYDSALSEIRQKKPNAIEVVKSKNEFFANYSKRLEEEIQSSQQLYKEVAEMLSKKIEENLEEINKLIKLLEEIQLVTKGAERIKSDMAYFKIPYKFPNSAKKCEKELKRRKVFNRLAVEKAEELEKLFNTEIALREAFQKKYGKYIPKELYPQLAFAVPSLRLAEMLRRCDIDVSITEEKAQTIINQYYKVHEGKKEDNNELKTQLENEAEIRKRLTEKLLEVEKKLEAAEQKLKEEIMKNAEVLLMVNDYNEKLNKSEMLLETHSKKEREQLNRISAYDSSIKQLKTSIEELNSQLKIKNLNLNSALTSLESNRNSMRQLKKAIRGINTEFRSMSDSVTGMCKNAADDFRKRLVGNLGLLSRQRQSQGNGANKVAKEASLSTGKIIQYFADFKIRFDKNWESSTPEKVLEYALDTLKAKELKLLKAFKIAREKLVAKTKEESNLRLSSLMSSQINSSGVSQIFSRDIVVGGSKSLSYENFMEGMSALFFRMPNKMYQALNLQCPFYFIDSSQHFEDSDYLVAAKIKTIRADKKRTEVLGLNKGQMAYSCTVDIIFKTNLKEPFNYP